MKKTAFLLSLVLLFVSFPSIQAVNTQKTTLENYFDHVRSRILEAGNKVPHYDMPQEDNPYAKGTLRVLILLCQFSDRKARIPYGDIAAKFDDDSGKSLKNYYKEASFGKLLVDYGPNGIKDWMTMPKPWSQYRPKHDEDVDAVVPLCNDALDTAIENGLDIAPYDADSNGIPDNVCYVWAGQTWTFGGDVPGSFCIPDDKGSFISIGENYRKDLGMEPFPPLVAFHEFAHLLRLYDLYDYAYYYDHIGAWDLMADGTHDGYGGLNAFQRWKAGWIDVKTIDAEGTYYVDDVNGDGTNKAYMIKIPEGREEYIFVENRQRKGADSYFEGVPGEGLVFYHLNNARPYKHFFNTLYGEYRAPGILVLEETATNLHKEAHFSKEEFRTKLNVDIDPLVGTYYLDNDTTESIEILDVSANGPRMSFRLVYKQPKDVTLRMSRSLDFGRIMKGQQKTLYLEPKATRGTYPVYFVPENVWIFTGASVTMTGGQKIEVIIDTAFLKKGPNSGYISYTSSGGEGRIKVLVDVAPRMGDVNLDDKVDADDYIEFLKYFLAKRGDVVYNQNADFNNDGIVDAADLIMLGAGFDYEPQ